MRKKKPLLIVGIVIALLLAGGIYYYVDRAHDPGLHISQRRSNGDDCFQIITMVLVPKSRIPLAQSVEDNIREFQDWNNSIVDEVYSEDYTLPIDVSSYGEVKNGQTTVRYEGYLTTKDGETVEYFREHTFDFVIAPDEEWPK